MNLAGLEQTLWNWASVAATASQGSGVTVYWDNPAAPRPPSPSVRLKIIAGPTMIGLDELQPSSTAPDDFTIVGPRQMTLSVTTYGPAARQLASDLQTSLSDPANVATLDAGGLSSMTTSPLRDLSQLMETQFEQRYQFDLELLTTEQYAVAPGSIQEADATGAITGSQGETITASITVTNP